MKITPMSGAMPSLPDAQAPRPDIKKIVMRTNFSPDRHEEELEQATEPQAGAEVAKETAISDTSVQAEGTAEVTQPISPQLAALAKQRRALQVKESEIAAKEKALEEQLSKAVDFEKIKANPLGILQQAGVSYDDLTNAILSNSSGINPEIQDLKKEIKALKEGVDKSLTERDQQVEQQVLSQMKKEADQLVAQGEDFEMIREHKMQQKVVDLVHQTWKKTGEILDVEEAARLIETELLNDALRFAKLNKVRSQLTPAQEQQLTQQAQPRQMRTLTNRDNASVPMSAKARAIAAFNGTLKK